MQSISATEAKQRLAALIDTAQREPVVIRRHDRDVAVLLSATEYERLRNFHVSEFQQFCDRMASAAKSKGMNRKVLDSLLKNER